MIYLCDQEAASAQISQIHEDRENERICAVLGISWIDGAHLRSLVRTASVIGVAIEMGGSAKSVEKRLRRIRVALHIRKSLHLAILYDRVSRGATARQAMEGIES